MKLTYKYSYNLEITKPTLQVVKYIYFWLFTVDLLLSGYFISGSFLVLSSVNVN